MIKIITPQKIESHNKFNNQRGDPRKYTWYKKAWYWAIKKELEGEEFEKVKEKRTVIIISVRSKLLDYGNLVGGSKPCLDILQDLDILYNDNAEWLSDFYHQEKNPKNQRTEIIIF